MIPSLKRLSFKHKNNKVSYYTLNYLRQLLPLCYYFKLDKKLSRFNDFDKEYLKERVDYYNKLNEVKLLPPDSLQLSKFHLKGNNKTHFFDLFEFTRFFNKEFAISYVFGDVTKVPEYPSIVKSRPIAGNNENSVLLKLDKIRHFLFVNDIHTFRRKKDMLVGRSKVNQENRARFLEMYYDHPMCNVGSVDAKSKFPGFQRPRMTIEEHLHYKFILCLEGYDVASNLKWVMSSNSVAVMPKPKYETWFMEGKLIPNYHYIQIKDDYSDLEERLDYYISHPEEAEKIIENAHQYIKPFKNKKQEDMISLLVLQKYFKRTGQVLNKEAVSKGEF